MNIKKLLIIEDDRDILEILGMIFSGEGYKVLLSETGEEISELESIRPDLVLLDLRLSAHGKEGAAICRRIKTQEATVNIPVILLSAEPDIRHVFAECGADAYLSKPFEVDELIQKVRRMLER